MATSMRTPTTFLSTPSARRATRQRGRPCPVQPISIHALREEGDTAADGLQSVCGDFYPRPPRGGRHLLTNESYNNKCISIHALREEGDCPAQSFACCRPYFYPRPPRGGRLIQGRNARHRQEFLSTPSARRATCHAAIIRRVLRVFLSTPSARRATMGFRRVILLNKNFYPRPPRGGRPKVRIRRPSRNGFLSTPSARRATHALYVQNRSVGEFLSTPSARRATAKTEKNISAFVLL